MDRSILFREFRDRVESEGFTSNVVSGMWNWLAEHLVSHQRTDELPAQCAIPLGKLMEFTPTMARAALGIGAGRHAVYRAVYKSFCDDPGPLARHSREVTRENLDEFAVDYSTRARGTAWANFLRFVRESGGSEESPAIEDLENYCEKLSTKRPRMMRRRLLNEWLEYLWSQSE